ncbi:hypothetical protein CDD83_1485 [Cordyceps sp. RAO-2017]|nr:hypothetical protein CDD83_1485 [Cordyceps sp. RAO-2017]
MSSSSVIVRLAHHCPLAFVVARLMAGPSSPPLVRGVSADAAPRLIPISEAQQRQEATPTEPMPPPQATGPVELDEAIIAGNVPRRGGNAARSRRLRPLTLGRHGPGHGAAAGGRAAPILRQGATSRPLFSSSPFSSPASGQAPAFSLSRSLTPSSDAAKIVRQGALGRLMCGGEFDSLRAIAAASPGFCPEPHAWGRCARPGPEAYFLLTEFRDIGVQVRAAASHAKTGSARLSPSSWARGSGGRRPGSADDER